MEKINILSLFDGISAGQVALKNIGIGIKNYYASEVDKNAIEVTQNNHPSTIQLGDVNNWRDWDIEWSKIDLLIGGSPCFVAGTKIITKGDYTPIEDVRVGDKVLTHKNRYQKVLRVGCKFSKIYEIQSQSGTVTETTSNHPYYARKRIKLWNKERGCYEFKFKEPEFIKVKDLTNDHYLATPILDTNENPLNLTEDECFLIGLYIGDGHTIKDYKKDEGGCKYRHWQLIISVGKHKLNNFKDIVGLKYYLHPHTQSTYRAVFSSKRLVNYVEQQCGTSSHTKKFGKGVLNLPNHLLKKVVEGYLFADGSFRNKTYRATTVSKDLVESLTLAVAKVFRTTTSIEFTKRAREKVIEGGLVNQSDAWTISFRKKHPKQSRAWVIDGFVWNPIKRLKETDKKKQVFNIEVDEDNSYVANNHVVHNCQGFSLSGKQLAFDDPRSKLFFVYVDILDHIKKINPGVKFLLENVKMKKSNVDIITDFLKVEPKLINSSLASAQNRERYYWFNWEMEGDIEDKNIVLSDILEYNKDYVSAAIRGRYINGKSGKTHQVLEVSGRKKSNALTTVKKDSVITPLDKGSYSGEYEYRDFTLIECERLQGFKDNYTSMVSKTQRRKALGNSWTVGIIEEIFKGLRK